MLSGQQLLLHECQSRFFFFFGNNYCEKFFQLVQETNDYSIYFMNTHSVFYVPRLFYVLYKYECASEL